MANIISVVMSDVIPGPKRIDSTRISIYIVLVDGNPKIGSGVELPVGAIAIWNDRKFFKTGSANTDWTEEVSSDKVRIVADTSPITISSREKIVLVTTVPMVINLPTADGSETIIIKDKTGAATAGSPITINPSGAETIDGESNLLIDSAYASVTLIGEGTEWSIL